MSFMYVITTVGFTLLATSSVAQYTATYTPQNAPDQSEAGQTGTNKCGTGSSPDSMCQNAYLNSVDDFCLFAPPTTTSQYGNSAIGNTEQIEVSWCTNSGYGTRVIPAGAINSAHFVKTPHYVQVTGGGDLTKLNIPAGDEGGELDPHGADGNGNPVGGLVFSSAFTSDGSMAQMHEWTNFMASNDFCFRACTDGDMAPTYCQHIYDTLGCGWNMPGDYDMGFTACEGDDTEPMGVYGSSTFYQGDAVTPDAHSPGGSSMCTTLSTIGSGNEAIQSGSANATTTTISNSTTIMTSSSMVSSVASGASASSSTITSVARSTSASSSASSFAGRSASSAAAAAATSSSAANEARAFGGVGAWMTAVMSAFGVAFWVV